MMKKKFIRALLALSLVSLTDLTSCAQTTHNEPSLLKRPKEVIQPHEIGIYEEQRYIIDSVIDLQGKICVIPNNVTLVFKGGIIKNGALVGQNTRIEYNGLAFDKVILEGTWICPLIKTSMFADLSYANSLKDVMALVNPEIHNKVIIDEGKYTVIAQKLADSCIPVRGNTELIINGTIELAPNEYGKYYILHLLGNDISIRGKGSLCGDRKQHLGTDGQWGFGIYLNKVHRVKITGISISECWGDCIYVYGNSSDILIKNCNLSYGRRQGISITSANNVTIQGCTISHIAGTAPEYAIDIEPNQNDTVRVVNIKNVTIEECVGGIKIDGNSPGAYIGKVDVKNCKVSATRRIPIWFFKCKSARAERCDITGSANIESIACEDVGTATIKHNSFNNISLMKEDKKSIVKRLLSREDKERIVTKNCGKTTMHSNWKKDKKNH